jgi:MerR family transcriptional regulator, repressor of the yfmOP operon
VSQVASQRPLRIGELAERTGTTVRTIRYYEEIGVLPERDEAQKGKHRCYDEADVEALSQLVRLRELLGLSLEELRTLVQADTARAELRRAWHEGPAADERRRILREALGHVSTQLALLAERRRTIGAMERELEAKRARMQALLEELDG